MELIWIPISVLGALLQAVRLAGQKSLNVRLSAMVTTYVRAFFGMPVLLLYLFAVKMATGAPFPEIHAKFLVYALGASIAQAAATVRLIRFLLFLSVFTRGQPVAGDRRFSPPRGLHRGCGSRVTGGIFRRLAALSRAGGAESDVPRLAAMQLYRRHQRGWLDLLVYRHDAAECILCALRWPGRGDLRAADLLFLFQ